MTVGTDTIQTLLRQRQALRQALQELRKDIASLDATASDLVASNIKNPAADSRAADPEPSKREKTAAIALASEDRGAPAGPNSAPLLRPKSTAPDKSLSPELPNNSPKGQPAEISDTAYDTLLDEAKQLSSYYLRHPAPDKNLPLQPLDDAVTKAEDKAGSRDRMQEYQNLRRSYRAVAGASFSETGITGKTLEDSRASIPVLWLLPMILCTLTLVVFPLLLLGRTLSSEMFNESFAADLIWIFGIAAAFLWGAAGALTLISLQVARLMKQRRYEADIRRSPGIRASLGGILGGGIFAALEIWLPHSNITAEFFLNLGAFAGGLVAWTVFLSIQRGLGKFMHVFEADSNSPRTKPVHEK